MLKRDSTDTNFKRSLSLVLPVKRGKEILHGNEARNHLVDKHPLPMWVADYERRGRELAIRYQGSADSNYRRNVRRRWPIHALRGTDTIG